MVMASDLTGVVLKEKWRIDALLGEGGVATVYAATHRNGKRVAVKVLHPQLASVAEIRERFLREGYVANRVEHPGCVSVLDDDTTADGLTFLVMDLLDGESLEKRLAREGRLPVKDVLSITDALLEVLAAAHANCPPRREARERLSGSRWRAATSRLRDRTAPGADCGKERDPERRGDGNAIVHAARAGQGTLGASRRAE